MGNRVASMVHTMRVTLRASQITSKFFLQIPPRVEVDCQISVAPPQGGYGAQTDSSNQYPQHGYNQGPYSQDPNNPQNQQLQHQGYQDPNLPPHNPNAPYDPNAPEGERGLGGAIAGGLAGHFAGNRMGNHGFLGLIGGAIAGSKLQDKYKGKNDSHHSSGSHHGSSSHHSSGGSSWGGR